MSARPDTSAHPTMMMFRPVVGGVPSVEMESHAPVDLLRSWILPLWFLIQPAAVPEVVSADALTFVWTGLPAQVRAGESFPVQIEIRRSDGTRAVDFSGDLWLSQVEDRRGADIVIATLQLSPALVQFANVSRRAVDLSGWSIHLYDSTTNPAPSGTFTVPGGVVSQPGDVFRLELLSLPPPPARYPAFRLSPRPRWTAGGPAAVLLTDAAGTPVDAVEIDLPAGVVQVPAAIEPAWWQGPPLTQGSRPGSNWSRVGALNHRSAGDWIPDSVSIGVANRALARPFSDLQVSAPLIPDRITVTAGVWNGSVTPTRAWMGSRLRADDRAGRSGDSGPLEVAAPYAVAWIVPGAMAEGMGSVQVTLRLDRPAESEVELELSALPAGPLTLPSSVRIPQGDRQAQFDLSVMDDMDVGAEVMVRLVARLADGVAGESIVVIADNEASELRLRLPAELREGESVGGEIELAGFAEAPRLVVFDVEPPGAVEVMPAQLTLGPGARTATVRVKAGDDSQANPARIARIIARSGGIVSPPVNVRISDDDIHELRISAAALGVGAGQALDLVVTALGEGGQVLAHRQDVLSFMPPFDVRGGTTAGVARLTNGIWSGSVVATSRTGVSPIQVHAGAVTRVGPPVAVGAAAWRFAAHPSGSGSDLPELVAPAGSNRLFLLTLANGLSEIDPETGRIAIRSGTPGGRHLVATDDGRFLYWAGADDAAPAVTRFDLDSGEWTVFPMTAAVAALQAVPGKSHQFLAATAIVQEDGVWNYGLFAFEDGAVLPRGAGFGPWGQSYTALVFLDAETVLGYEGHVTSFRFARHRLWPDGVEFIDVPSSVEFGPYDLWAHEGLVYGYTGAWDPLGGRMEASLPFPGRPWRHAQSGTVVAIEPASPPRLRGFELATLADRGSTTLPEKVEALADVAFWGASGVAIADRAGVWLTSAPFLSSEGPPNLVVQIREPTEPVSAGQPAVVEVVVVNRGGSPVSQAVLRYEVPAGSEVINVETAGVVERVSDGVFVQWDGLPPGATNTVGFWVVPGDGDILKHVAEVATPDDETDLLDNRAEEWTAVRSANAKVLSRTLVAVSDLVADSNRNRFYGAVHQDGHPRNGWVVAFDSEGGPMEGVVRIGTAPGRIFLSEDSRQLSVLVAGGARLRRVDLDRREMDLDQVLPFVPRDLALVPGRPGSLALLRSDGLGVFVDGGIVRAAPTSLYGRLLQPGEQRDVVYSFMAEPGMARVTAPPGEPEVLLTAERPWMEFDAEFQQTHGSLVASWGAVVDGPSLAYLGTLGTVGRAVAAPGAVRQLVVADPPRNRAYALMQSLPLDVVPPPYSVTLVAYSLHNLEEVGRVEIGGLRGSPEGLVMQGANRLAFRTAGDQVVVVETPHGNGLSPADLVVTQVPADGPHLLGGTAAFRMGVTNAGPATATDVRMRSVVPPGMDFVNVVSGGDTVKRLGRVVEIGLGDLPAGHGREVEVRAIDRSNAEETHHATVASANPDSNWDNNRSEVRTSTGFVSKLELAATDLAYDASGGRLIATVGSAGGSWSNSVVAISLDARSIDSRIPLDGEPVTLAVSENGRFAWAALAGTREVVRIDLQNRSVDFRLDLGPGEGIVAGYVGLVAVSGAPESVLVTLNETTVVFDGAVPRPVRLAPGFPNQVVATAPPGQFLQSTWNGLHRIALESDGLRIIETVEGVSPGIEPGIAVSGSWVAFHSGQLFDLASGQVVTTFPAGGLALPAKEEGRLYLVHAASPFSATASGVVQAFDPATGMSLWSTAVPGLSGSLGRFVSAGDRRWAGLVYGARVVVMDLSRIPPPATADLVLTVEPPSARVTRGGPVLCRFTVVNRGPWRAGGSRFEAVLPEGVSLLAGRWFYGFPEVEGALIVDGNVARADLPFLANQEVLFVDLQIMVEAEGSRTLVASVTATGSEDRPVDEAEVVLEGLPWPTVHLHDASVVEGPFRTAPVLTLSEAATVGIDVTLAVRSGTALAGSDFNLPSETTVTFPAGTTNRSVQLQLVDDLIVEDDEIFSLELVRASQAVLGRSTASIRIRDNDSYRFSVSTPAPMPEGDEGVSSMPFLVQLTPPAQVPLSVQYLIAGGTAQPVSDFLGTGGRLEFPPGMTNLTVYLPVVGDRVAEAEETVNVSLFAPEGDVRTSVGLATGTGRILNDDEWEPLVIETISAGGGVTEIRVSSLGAGRYSLQWRPELGVGGWHLVSSRAVEAGTPVLLQHVAETETATGFYQVVFQP